MEQFKSLFDLLSVFDTEQKCREYLELLRWGNVVRCPFCMGKNPNRFKDGKTLKCSDNRCRKKFNIKTGTIFENSKISLRKWFTAIYIHSSHKKGVSSIQLSKDINVTQKTAWFMLHRIREMMKEKGPIIMSGTVEADETFVGGKNKNRHKDKKVPQSQGRSFKDKTPVLGLLNRETKRVACFVVPNTSRKYIHPIVEKTVFLGSRLMTDEWRAYRGLGSLYFHEIVDHSRKQYSVGDVTTNSIEGFWSHLKRGIFGVYHWVSRKHLQSYCNEFSFRYNTKDLTESERFDLSLSWCEGRLKYTDLVV